MPPARDDAAAAYADGFTLLETIAALGILAIALTSLLELYSTSTKGARAGDSYLRAQLLTQSLLAEASASRELPVALREGTLDGMRWQVLAAEIVGPTALQTRDPRWRLVRLTVAVRFDVRRQIVLESARLFRSTP